MCGWLSTFSRAFVGDGNARISTEVIHLSRVWQRKYWRSTSTKLDLPLIPSSSVNQTGNRITRKLRPRPPPNSGTLRGPSGAHQAVEVAGVAQHTGKRS